MDLVDTITVLIMGHIMLQHMMIMDRQHTMGLINRQHTMGLIFKLHTPNILCRDCLSGADHRLTRSHLFAIHSCPSNFVCPTTPAQFATSKTTSQ